MSRSNNDRLLLGTLWLAAALSGGLVLLVAVFLIAGSLPALGQPGPVRFAVDRSWHPAAGSSAGFNLLPAVAGSVLAAACALALAAPLGVLSALFARYYAPGWLAWPYRRLVELMAGVPSVVYGLWGLMVLVPLVARMQPPGASLLSAAVVLALMVLPTVALLSDAALAQVPADYLRAAAALGLSRTRTLLGVLVPAARHGLATAVLLAMARALGETMAVVMVCGNVMRWPASLFDPVRTLTGTIALEMGYARDVHRSALFVCGLVLLAMVVLLVWAAEVAGRRRHHGEA